MEYLHLIPLLAVMISQVASQSLMRNLLSGLDLPDHLTRSQIEDMLDSNILNRLQNQNSWGNLGNVGNLGSLNSLLGARGNGLGNSMDLGDLGSRLGLSSNNLLGRLGGRMNGLLPRSLNNLGNGLSNSILPGSRLNSLNSLNSMDDDCILVCMGGNTLSLRAKLSCNC